MFATENFGFPGWGLGSGTDKHIPIKYKLRILRRRRTESTAIHKNWWRNTRQQSDGVQYRNR